MPDAPPDPAGIDALLASARSGDKAAEETLLSLLSARLYEVAKRRLRNEEDARDAAAETLATAWSRYQHAEMPGGFLPWVFTILRNKIGNALKRARTAERLVPIEAADEAGAAAGAAGPEGVMGPAAETPDEAIDRRRLEVRLRAALARLPAECRRIFRLLIGGGTRAEILTAFPGERPGTVDSRISRCRSRLHALLEEEGWEP